jgi:hypothetical protein
MNAFKTVRRNIASNSSSTISYKNKEANFNLALDFPCLTPSNTTTTTTTTTTAPMDYSNTFTPTPDPTIVPNPDPDIKIILEPRMPPPGWHKYSLNKSTRVMTVDYGKGTGPASNANVTHDNIINHEYIEGQHFIKMMNRLEETQLSHAEQFIECYGYDCYERTFLMPNYIPQYFSDASDRDSNNDSSNDFSSDDDR